MPHCPAPDRRGHALTRLSLVVALVLGTQAANAQPVAPRLDTSRLPKAWRVVKSADVPTEQLGVFSQKLGGQIEAISNHVLDIRGLPLQINLVRCANEIDAKAVHRFMLDLGKTDETCQREGRHLVEFVAQARIPTQLRKKLRWTLGLPSPTVTWSIDVHLAPLERSDDRVWNDLFNALRLRDDAEQAARIAPLSARFAFGDSLWLAREDATWGQARFRVTPAAKETSQVGDSLRVRLGDVPTVLGVPRVRVQATIPTQGFRPFVPSAPIDREALLCATDSWPVRADPVLEALTDASRGAKTDAEKAEAILAWVYRSIRYEGKTGSRWGTLKVLEQGFGHCWDKADVFVTLCRAAGIPARMVFGWLVGVSGHVWTQVHLEGQGWVGVDATASWVGVSEDYVPLMISEAGEVSAVYWAAPQITR